MENDVKEPKPKKSIWAAIWESMTKTGGCCGSGGNCCGAPRADSNSPQKTDASRNSCCGK